MKKLYIITSYMLLTLMTLVMQGCLKEQEDVFEDSPIVRLEEFIDQYRTVLESSEDGWVMDYYPQSDQSMGGIAYIVKFKDGEVTAWWEKDTSKSVTSNYAFKKSIGAMLTFYTYNEFLHYYAEGRATTELYQGYKGDFEFRLDSIVGNDHVYMHGKRHNSVISLHRFSGDPVEYLSKVNELSESVIMDALLGTYDHYDINASVNVDNRQMIYTITDTNTGTAHNYTRPFTFTPDGVRLYKPLTINGKRLTEFTLEKEGDLSYLRGKDEGLTDLRLRMKVTGYVSYPDYAGTYTFVHRNGSNQERIETTVQLVPNGDGKTYTMTGISLQPDAFTLKLNYVPSRGTLILPGQIIGTTEEGWDVWLAPYSRRTTDFLGTVYQSTNYGMELQHDEEAEGFLLKFSAYDPTQNVAITSFTIRFFSGSTRMDSSTNMPGEEWYFSGKPYDADDANYAFRLYYLESLIKQ